MCYNANGVSKFLANINRHNICYRCGETHDSHKPESIIITCEPKYISFEDISEQDSPFYTAWQTCGTTINYQGQNHQNTHYRYKINTKDMYTEDLSYDKWHEPVYKTENEKKSVPVTEQRRIPGARKVDHKPYHVRAGNGWVTKIQTTYYTEPDRYVNETKNKLVDNYKKYLVKAGWNERIEHYMTYYAAEMQYSAYSLAKTSCCCYQCLHASIQFNMKQIGDQNCLNCGFNHHKNDGTNQIFALARGQNLCSHCDCLHCVYDTISHIFEKRIGCGCNTGLYSLASDTILKNATYKRLVSGLWSSCKENLFDKFVKFILARNPCNYCLRLSTINLDSCRDCCRDHHDILQAGCGDKNCHLCKCFRCAYNRNPKIQLFYFFVFEDEAGTVNLQATTIINNEYPEINNLPDDEKQDALAGIKALCRTLN